jgi:hypothetical protein
MALYTTSTSFPVRWHGSDGLSGLDHHDLYYRDESAADWTLWLEDVTITQSTFLGTPGHTYHLCSRGVDQVGNQEDCPPACVEGDQCGWRATPGPGTGRGRTGCWWSGPAARNEGPPGARHSFLLYSACSESRWRASSIAVSHSGCISAMRPKSLFSSQRRLT